MKLILATLLFVLSGLSLKAQLWETEITPYVLPLPPPGFESELKGYDVQETSDGNYMFAGNHQYGLGTNFSYVPTLSKIDATTGNELWQRQYPMFGGGYLQEVSLIEKPNGNLLIAGLNFGQIYLIETDALGDTIKTTTYNSACSAVNNISCTLRSIRLRASGDGNYVMGVGAHGGLIGIPTPANELIKIAPDHSVLWNKVYDQRFLLDCQPTSDGGYIFSGSTVTSQAILFKVDANGDSLWQQPYTNIPVYELHSLKETPDHGFVVAGYISGFAGTNAYVFKLDSTGANEEWSLILGPQEGKARDVIVDNNGNYIVTGTKQVTHGGGFTVMIPAAFVSKISPSGTLLQDQIFDDLIDNSSRAVRQTSAGDFIIAGSHGSALGNQNRGYVVKTGYTLNIIDTEKRSKEVNAFPNPFQIQTTIQVQKESYSELSLELYDALGRQVPVSYTVNAKGIVLSRGSLEAGMYWFNLTGDDEPIHVGKLIVK